MAGRKETDGVHLQLYSTAPAPSRDYYGLTVTTKDVILNIWNVSHGPHVYPKRQKVSLPDFEEEKLMKEDINRVFGQHVTDYVTSLAKNEKNVQFMPTKIFLYILRLLANNDILHLSQTSKIFFELCSSNSVWRILFRKRVKKSPTPFEFAQSEYIPWRELLKKKIGLKRHVPRRPIREVLNGAAEEVPKASTTAYEDLKKLQEKKSSGKELNKIHNLSRTNLSVLAKAEHLRSVFAKDPNFKIDNKNISNLKKDNLDDKLNSIKYVTPFVKPKDTSKQKDKKLIISTDNAPKPSTSKKIVSIKSPPAKQTKAPKAADAQKKSIFPPVSTTPKSLPKSTTSILERAVKNSIITPTLSASTNKVNVLGEKENPKVKKSLTRVKKPPLSTKQKLYVHNILNN